MSRRNTPPAVAPTPPSSSGDSSANDRIAELVRRAAEHQNRPTPPAEAADQAEPSPQQVAELPDLFPMHHASAPIRDKATREHPAEEHPAEEQPATTDRTPRAEAPAATDHTIEQRPVTAQLPSITVEQPAVKVLQTTRVRQPKPARNRPDVRGWLSRIQQQPQAKWIALGAAALVALLVWAAVAAGGGPNAKPTSPKAKTAAAPAGYAVQVTDTIRDCAGHSRGKTRATFRAVDCTAATRTLATGVVNGRTVLYVISSVEMPTARSAATLKKVVDGSGTGNLNDLLREGRRFSGSPKSMPSSGYASLQNGQRVVIAEAGFIDGGPSSNTDPALRAAAAQAAAHANT